MPLLIYPYWRTTLRRVVYGLYFVAFAIALNDLALGPSRPIGVYLSRLIPCVSPIFLLGSV